MKWTKVWNLLDRSVREVFIPSNDPLVPPSWVTRMSVWDATVGVTESVR